MSKPEPHKKPSNSLMSLVFDQASGVWNDTMGHAAAVWGDILRFVVRYPNDGRPMPRGFVALVKHLVSVCQKYAAWVAVLALIVVVGCGAFIATHFSINTDVSKMMPADLEWRQREIEMANAFPNKEDLLVVVIDGKTAEQAEDAADQLATRLAGMSQQFSLVERPDAIPFFRKNGLLFLPSEQIATILGQVVEAQPMLAAMVTDPSLRGLMNLLKTMTLGLKAGQADSSRLDPAYDAIANTIDAAVKGNPLPLAWSQLRPQSDTASARDVRKYILTKPVLDYGNLEPGAAASKAIRDAAQQLNLTADHGVTVRLTGSVALNDEEFASVASGTGWATALSGAVVVVILFFALRSFRLVVPILLTLGVGLVITTAFALLTVKSLNLISVAFAVMFIGIAVDFGIQFGVRYRDMHYQEPDHETAVAETVQVVATPLSLAAAAVALGFFAFIPTSYRGVSELGFIAGSGMIIAYVLNLTLLPALLEIAKPPAEAEPVGFRQMAPVDAFLLGKRRLIKRICAGVALVVLVGATQVRFDFDPLNLKDPHTESVSTLFDLMKDPEATPYAVSILSSDLDAAQDLANRLEVLPTVDHAMTLASFVPAQQDAKLQQIGDTLLTVGPTFDLPLVTPVADDDAIIDSMTDLVTQLREVGGSDAAASHLAQSLDEAMTRIVVKKDAKLLHVLHSVLVEPLRDKTQQIKELLSASRVTIDQIGDDLRHDWIAPDGHALIQVYPKGNPRDHDVLSAFTNSVLDVAPNATGAPVSIQASGNVVIEAFALAGLYAVLAIILVAWLVLRDIGDVARMVAPLIFAGGLTLATIALFGLSLNYANIIALPLLLSLGVSYAVYFVFYWREGSFAFLQSSMARAVLFSAATVFVAFSSLIFSSHPGTASMGILLTLALLYSLLCTFFMLPCLLGIPKLEKEQTVTLRRGH